MNKSRISLITISVILFLLAGCSGPKQVPAGSDSADLGLVSLNREVYDQYSADFQLQFQGSTSWSYQLKTRVSPELYEVNLHIEGVQGAQNPGDIRLVTDGSRTWISGEGTDQECITFPNNQGMDPTFIFPESLVDLGEVQESFTLVGEEVIGGANIQHYQAVKASTGPWEEAEINVWQVKSSGLLYRFNMQARGEDPYFGGGSGTMKASYQANELGSDPIQPVGGCEVRLPLPANAEMIVRLPGMASFESQDGVDTLQAFFQSQLPVEGWGEIEPPAQSEGVKILSFRRGTESLEVQIESTAGGSKVKLLFLEE